MCRVVSDTNLGLKQLKSTPKSTTYQTLPWTFEAIATRAEVRVIETKACIPVTSVKFLCLNRVIVIVAIHCFV